MAAKTFQTHTGLLIFQTQEGKGKEAQHVVSIVGTQEKELLRTPVKSAATKYYDGLVKHYEQRAKDEA